MSARSGTSAAPVTESSDAVAAALSPWPASLVEERTGPAGSQAVTLHHFGYVRLIRCGEGPLRLVQGAQEAAGVAGPAGRDAVVLVAVRGATTVRLAQGGRGVALADGQFALVDLRRAYAVEGDDGAGVLLLRLPVHALCVAGAVLRSATGRSLVAEDHAAGPLWSLLRHLDGAAWGTTAAVGERLGGIVVDLVAALVQDLVHGTGGGTRTAREQLVDTVRAYIDEHLADPELCAESIARAHLLSVRYLHRLFEDEDVSVGRLIQRRRVERCAQELARRQRVSPSLASVAARWGFGSAAHFSRAFKAVHGHSPQKWRRSTAAGGEG